MQLWEDLGRARRGPGRGWFEKRGLGMMSRATPTEEDVLCGAGGEGGIP